MDSKQEKVTILLQEAGNGNTDSANELFDLVYGELQKMARYHLRAMSNAATINTTALVHEAYLKLFSKDEVSIDNRVHFFAICGKVMRQILVDYYRKKTALKRGGSAIDNTLHEEFFPKTDHRFELLDLDIALTKLNTLNPRLSTVVECKFFASMKDEEIALFLGVTDRTIRNDWRKARMWLSRELAQGA